MILVSARCWDFGIGMARSRAMLHCELLECVCHCGDDQLVRYLGLRRTKSRKLSVSTCLKDTFRAGPQRQVADLWIGEQHRHHQGASAPLLERRLP